ncbi:ribosomal protein L7/L12 [Streptomyces sp. NBC_00091]|uniref:ribosomal protein L7/L12 n=1 Tax=Streptomyces sp. NBC_00091 TaxID=2975648 RepID=UPI0022545BAC|nr:ribosomal protein L7/L12 [Streptomyces sp. NBC_00091]MCX5377518.1 ribosomal protein L7/L12 [Streptomyces sp. NBC_00091]
MNTLFLLLALLATAGWITSTVTLKVRALEDKADRLERRLGRVLDHFGIEEPEPAGMDEVRALMRDGRTISAIKVYRQITGVGLAEAKRAVESLDPVVRKA